MIDIKYNEVVNLDGCCLDIIKNKGNALKVQVDTSKEDIEKVLTNLIKCGNIAYLLNKPYNYVLYCFSYFVGEAGIKLLTNGIVGVLIGLVFAGSLKGFNLLYLPLILLSIILGCCINFFIYITLALTSF